VVRSTIPRWHRDHELHTVAWTPGRAALRTLQAPERARILHWGSADSNDSVDSNGSAVPDDISASDNAEDWKLIVPWRSVVVLPEVPSLDTCGRLAALAEFSGNRVVAVGYDCIPVISADMVPIAEPNRFVRYLSVVKYLDRIAGISVSATTEFEGFSEMLATQGLRGPTVLECALPVDATDTASVQAPLAERPSVLCVGSFEPRKNQLALLYAAEVLWREGLDFELRFVGGGGWGREFPAMVRRLAGQGRPVSTATAIGEDELREAYRGSWFTVFTSVHEGYGLPVAESLALGTPVITTNYGSTREIGRNGGTVLIDPRDDAALVEAMRGLLTDPEQIEKLREEIRNRPVRTWDDYARDLWAALVPSDREVSR
jgi:glycosyltransferase involved in cell wall biosynthesis